MTYKSLTEKDDFCEAKVNATKPRRVERTEIYNLRNNGCQKPSSLSSKSILVVSLSGRLADKNLVV